MKNILFSLALIFIATSTYAQQEIILTKYTFNSLFFNPAYAGSHGWDEGSVVLHYRNQWLGIEGAPTTIMAGGELSLFEDRVGLGITLAQESIGVEKRFDLGTNYAYRIDLGNGQLAGGLRVGGSFYNTDFSDINNEEAGDLFDGSAIDYKVFTTGAGIYYHNEGLYLGVAVPTLVAIGNAPGTGYKERHFYGHLGLMIGDEYSTIRFEPSLLLKYQKAAPLQITLGVNAWLMNGFAVGAHWRSDDAIALSSELILDNKYRFAAAYDYTIGGLRKESNGTLEFMLGYMFNTSPEQERIRNIRHGGRF